jgi:hypothetical protein
MLTVTNMMTVQNFEVMSVIFNFSKISTDIICSFQEENNTTNNNNNNNQSITYLYLQAVKGS